ncbi:MAG: hypothetical protein HC932_00460 [Thermales bacterium]|nr:hypothetical protein [Thermales bacterium]
MSGYEDIKIVGHSIDFDISFMKNESWFLPSTSTIDTLDIAKIVYPDMNAVNLEYLIEQLHLNPTAHQIKSLQLSQELILNSHRALYDTICCLNLLSQSLSRISEMGLSQNFYDQFDSFLGIGLEYFSKEITTKNNRVRLAEVNHVGLDGRIIPIGIWSKIKLLGYSMIETKLNELLSKHYQKDYLLIMLQIFVINRLQLNNIDNISYKIHTKNPKEVVFTELILGYLVTEKDSRNGFELLPIETIIPNIKVASEKSYQFGRFVTLVEIFLDIFIDKGDIRKEITIAMRKIISAYDFMLLALQPLYQRGEYTYNYTTLEPEEVVIQRKLVDFENLLISIKSFDLPHQGEVTHLVVKAIVSSLEKFFDDGVLQINPKNKLTFRYFGNQLYINKPIKYFNIQTHLDELMKKFPDLVFTTYLAESNLESLLELIGVRNKVQMSKVKFLNKNNNKFESIDNDVEFDEFIQNNIESAKKNKGINLILGGQNSTIRDSERVLIKNFSPKDYLLLGESGSLTKILSKMQNGFSGLVVVKIGDFGYLSRFISDYDLKEILDSQPSILQHQ